MSAIAITADRPPVWRRLIGFNLLTGIVLAGSSAASSATAIGDQIPGANIAYYVAEAGQNDIAILLGYFVGVVGFLAGLGLRQLPVQAAARLSADARRARVRG